MTQTIEQLTARVRELEKERDAALETIKQQHRIHVELVEKKEIAEAKADEEQKHSCKMAYQRDIANVEITSLKSVLRDAKTVLVGVVQGDYDGSAAETIAAIDEVLK